MRAAILNPREIDEKAFPKSGKASEQLRFLLNYAVLAPSNHNSQPWLFRIIDNRVDIIFDRTRALSIVDPNNRELIISCGAAIGTLELAAKYFGYTTNIGLSSDKEHPNLLATVTLTMATEPSTQDIALFKAIKERRTNRSPFGKEEIPDVFLKRCELAAQDYDVEFSHCSDEQAKSAIAELVERADLSQFSRPWFRVELASWMHSKNTNRKDGMSAHRFGIPDILTPIAGFIIRRFNLGKRVSVMNRRKIESGSPVLCILAHKTDNQHAWVNTGRALANVLLTLTSEGFSASYLNQPIETDGLRSQLGKVLHTLPYPQIMLRVGRADNCAASVRRAVEDCLAE